MSQIDDLTAAVTALQQSVSDEIARVEAVILALQNAPPSPAIDAAIAALTASKTQLDAERPAPPPAVKG